MRKLILLVILIPFFSYSQKTDVLARASMRYLKGFSLGLLVQGQTKYPSPYYGPEVKGLYNDGAYHFIADVYIGDLTPGTFVINVKKENEWGIGQVQSSINNIITINFENVGKKTINPKEVELKIININGTN